MATEIKTIQLTIDADIRLVAAAGGVARYWADAAGLSEGVAQRWQAATKEACEEALGKLGGRNSRLDVRVSRLADRFEVTVVLAGNGAPITRTVKDVVRA